MDLLRAGADPLIGRKIAWLFAKAKIGMCGSSFFRESYSASIDRFRFLEDLPLTGDEQSALAQIRENIAKIPAEHQLVHLPYFLILAVKRG